MTWPGDWRERAINTRGSLPDIGQTGAENFGLKVTVGESFVSGISQLAADSRR